MPELETLSKSKPAIFNYTGSVKNGTVITFGSNNSKEKIRADIYTNLLEHFQGFTVMAGTSHDNRNKDRIGYWLYDDTNGPKLSRRVVTSYICSILIHEGFCESSSSGNTIWIKFLPDTPK